MLAATTYLIVSVCFMNARFEKVPVEFVIKVPSETPKDANVFISGNMPAAATGTERVFEPRGGRAVNVMRKSKSPSVSVSNTKSRSAPGIQWKRAPSAETSPIGRFPSMVRRGST
jgi:hypothetical protein